MKKSAKILTAAALSLTAAAACAAGLYYQSQGDGVTVDGISYHSGMGPLDLRNEEITPEHYVHLQQAFPDREILWNVPFQLRHYSSDTEKITISSLTEEDTENLRYLKNLKQIDAENCFDYEALSLLRTKLPGCRIESCVAIGGEIFDWDTASLEFSGDCLQFEEFYEKLRYFPKLQKVFFREPELQPEELLKLQEAYPSVDFSWEKTLFGRRRASDLKDLDISGQSFQSVEEIESQAAYLPELQSLVMCDTGLSNEEIAAFRERSTFKVIWNVKIRDLDLRTDAVWFVPAQFGREVRDCDTRNLKYCEGLHYVDLSRNIVKNIDWVWGTPHLQYLIIQGSPLRDIQALRSLKELKLLEISKTDLRDLRPLTDCTALEDLNLEGAYGDISPIGEMTWLKTLRFVGAEQLQEDLPDTSINRGSWKDLKNYRDMLELLNQQGPVLPEKK